MGQTLGGKDCKQEKSFCPCELKPYVPFGIFFSWSGYSLLDLPIREAPDSSIKSK